MVVLVAPVSAAKAAPAKAATAQDTAAIAQQAQAQLAMLQATIAQFDGVTLTDPNQIAALDAMKAQAALLEQQLAALGATTATTATATKAATTQQVTVATPAPTTSYIGNKNSKKFHSAGCSAVAKMKDSNKVALASRDAAIAAGYEPCKICKP
jgi:hypothetical protein